MNNGIKACLDVLLAVQADVKQHAQPELWWELDAIITAIDLLYDQPADSVQLKAFSAALDRLTGDDQ